MMENLLRSSIKTLTPYQPLEYSNVIRLDANENNYGSRLLNQKLAKALMEVNINQYPDTDCTQLRGMLAKVLMVSEEELLIGCGSDQLIVMLLNAFIDKGDKIVTSSPTFTMYKISNQIAGGVTVEIPLKQDFEFDYYEFIKEIKKENPKLVFITNPNNPTGGVIPREQIIKIIEHSNAIVVVDEAYYEFYQESVIDLTSYYSNLVVLRTLSKAYGLAGTRVGYSVASKELTGLIKRVKPPYNVSSLDQAAARVCLENKPLFDGIIEEIILQRGRLAQELAKLEGLRVYESFGNFLLVRYEKATELYSYLLEKGIVIRYFGSKGALENCLRISIGTAEENTILLEVLGEYFGVENKAAKLKQVVHS